MPTGLSKAVESNEFVTPYTLRAENVTSKLTGVVSIQVSPRLRSNW